MYMAEAAVVGGLKGQGVGAGVQDSGPGFEHWWDGPWASSLLHPSMFTVTWRLIFPTTQGLCQWDGTLIHREHSEYQPAGSKVFGGH